MKSFKEWLSEEKSKEQKKKPTEKVDLQKGKNPIKTHDEEIAGQ